MTTTTFELVRNPYGRLVLTTADGEVHENVAPAPKKSCLVLRPGSEYVVGLAASKASELEVCSSWVQLASRYWLSTTVHSDPLDTGSSGWIGVESLSLDPEAAADPRRCR